MIRRRQRRLVVSPEDPREERAVLELFHDGRDVAPRTNAVDVADGSSATNWPLHDGRKGSNTTDSPRTRGPQTGARNTRNLRDVVSLGPKIP
jgi:hypothetical protein